MFDLSLLWCHSGAASYVFAHTAPAYSGFVALFNGTYDFNHIPAYDYLDFTVRIAVTKGFTLTAGVNNLLDKAPPLIGGTIGTMAFDSGNTYPSTYDAIGRRFAVSTRVRF